MERPISMRNGVPRLRSRFAGAGLAAVLLLSTATFTMPATPAYAADLNVTSYGVSNAGADSTAALQSLLAGGGKTLAFPAGTYRFGGISIPANSTLKFASGAKIVPGGGSSTFFSIGTSGVTISGGEFDGQGTIGNAVVGSSASGLTITGTSVTNVTGAHVNLVGCSNAMITGNSSTNAQYGIIASGTTYSTIDGNYAYNMGRDGILVYSGAHHVTISNNYVERWANLYQDGRAAIHTYGASDLTVFGNTVKNGLHNAEGIRFRDSERFDAYNNTVDNIGGSGIAVVWIGDWEAVNGLVGGNGTIRQNTINNTHLRGVSVPYRNIKPVRILDNTITNTSSNFVPIDPADGIICFPPNSVVAGNRITGSTGNGISVASANTLVADNVISTVGTQPYGARSGVANYGTQTSIIRNTINGSASFGVYNAGSMYLEGNTITNAANGASNTGATAGKLYGDTIVPSVWSDIATSYNAGATFTISASDANSGIAAIRTQVDSGPVRTYSGTSVTMDVGTAGTHIISYWSMDNAGNVSAKQSRTYTVGGIVTPPPTPTPEPTPTPTPVPTPTTVNTPANLAGKAFEFSGSSIVNLTWEDTATNETGFTIERAYEHDGILDPWVPIDTLAANAVSYDDRVALGTIYRYRVRAHSGDGTSRILSAYSNEARILMPGSTPTPTPTPTPEPTVTPVPNPVPIAPSGLSASPTRIRTVQLAWTDNAANETGYEIWCKRSGVWNLYASVPSDSKTYTTKRFSRGTYEFRVRAYNSAGASTFSPAVVTTVR